MANANANLMSLANMSKATNSTTRPQNSLRANRANSDAKNSKSNVNFSSSRSQKNNFGSELDKANAQINQSQQQPEEVQAVAENVESEPVNELAKAPTHGKSKHKQDAPNQQNLPKNENPQPIAENVAAENIVAERISPTIPAQIPTTIDVEEPEIISQNVEVEIVSAPQDTPKFSKEIPLNPFNNVSEKVAENSTPTIPVNLRDEVIDVAETPTLASSADMAFYFASTTENLLAVKDTPVATEKNNLMSIMPQTHDDKAQSMLNLLSGRTWQSPTIENDSAQNVNLQNLSPQPNQTVQPQQVSIQPQFNSRPLNIPTLNQNPLQVQKDIQPIVNQNNLQVQPDIQPTLNQNNLQPQTDIQPTLNQNSLQPQTDYQPIVNQNPLQPQTDYQPTLNQNPLQPQTDYQPIVNQNPFLQPQTDYQPIVNQNPLQPQTNYQPIVNQNNFQPQTDYQPIVNQNPLQPQTNYQPIVNQNPLQVQTDYQPIVNQNPLQPQTNYQPIVNQNNFQHQTDIQPTLNQNSLQVQTDYQPTLQAQPQVQQQQFGAQINPQINSLQPQVEAKNVTPQAMNNLLGVEVQVENNLTQSTPVIPLQDFSQQFEQNQQFTRNFQQNFTTLTPEVETEISKQPEGAENFAGNVATALNQTQNNQPAAQVQAPEVPQAPREDFNVPAQIVEQARMIRTATNTEMVINLKPEHLGELTLRVSVSTNGAVTASFYTDNAQVRAIIENSLVQLKQELNDQGIKVDDVEVYAGLNEEGLLNGQGQQAWQQNQQRNQRGTIDLGAVEEELDALTPVNENLSADGVDYKV